MFGIECENMNQMWFDRLLQSVTWSQSAKGINAILCYAYSVVKVVL